ncbi:DUF4097 family beta strand repeat protein [Kineosporia sp. J2-2]|uniref:DUF4097 family beta strand repeat protein n=1 Tax=Kineosporia corallincola TaxID=2835133 RepID=A0ABS5TI66_9ACTN|nr:DUF4097 family beta strand repeat-containing protein [Kineosporia corallincola]MBT0770740.1 DUF4097 family beta strand repeat protein [Kineosporia corallincola]
MTTQTPEFPAVPAPPRPRHPGRRRAVRLVTGGVAAVIVVTVAAGVTLFWSAQEETTRKGFSDGVTQLRVRTDTGHITVRAGAEGEPVSLKARSRTAFATPDVVTSEKDGTLEVEGRCTGRFPLLNLCSIDLDLVVPAGVSVTAVTDTGDVVLEGTTAGGSASTDTGDIELTSVGGTLTLETDTGKVTGTGLTGGGVTASSDTGDIELSFGTAPDTVRATTDTGDAVVRVPDDGQTYRVDAETDNGERTVRVPEDDAAAREITLKADTGDVSVVH